MPGCRGKCEFQVTRILTDPIVAEVKTDPPNAPLVLAQKADVDAAKVVLDAKIALWSQRYPIVACNAAAGCVCNQTEEPDWDSRKTLKREVGVRFTSAGKKFTLTVELEYKVAFVDGACEEPPGTIWFVGSMGHFEELGVTVAADSDILTAERLAKVKKALT